MDSENNPHQRIQDRWWIQRFWARIHPYWHIGTTVCGVIIAGLFWIRDVSGYDQRITEVTARVSVVESGHNIDRREISRLGERLEGVGQRVDDIAYWLGVPVGYRKAKGKP